LPKHKSTCGITGETAKNVPNVARTAVDQATSILSAVEQQDAATIEISVKVQRAAEGTGSVKTNMSDLSQAVARTSQNANLVQEVSSEVSQETGTLKLEVNLFPDNAANA
jgi:methyl-accepting chemotaxis protein